ncbi:hypothetical protein GL174_21595 (plasmid) [Sphingobium sp. CAP-1]|nr:hypothetical protein GL174_21595 [Sphingobium sp. CAP-1]
MIDLISPVSRERSSRMKSGRQAPIGVSVSKTGFSMVMWIGVQKGPR